jgi:hypothetical protein
MNSDRTQRSPLFSRYLIYFLFFWWRTEVRVGLLIIKSCQFILFFERYLKTKQRKLLQLLGTIRYNYNYTKIKDDLVYFSVTFWASASRSITDFDPKLKIGVELQWNLFSYPR